LTKKIITFEEAEMRSRVIKAIAHPVRLIMIDALRDGEMSFSTLFGLFNLDKSTVSKHLLTLKVAGIASSRKEGNDTIYRLEVPCVTDFFDCVTAVIQGSISKQVKCLSCR
jgi:ArsR family transcriptional regulator, arsenate/arsenite/antimonite-responsive transcriptional repressor